MFAGGYARVHLTVRGINIHARGDSRKHVSENQQVKLLVCHCKQNGEEGICNPDPCRRSGKKMRKMSNQADAFR